ncbi:MAG: hypothetical protein GDA52_02110, partial [Rhodobacteraceae bacterium]|nr:hypothetical protein [Paracoccaceae bacterium]
MTNYENSNFARIPGANNPATGRLVYDRPWVNEKWGNGDPVAVAAYSISPHRVYVNLRLDEDTEYHVINGVDQFQDHDSHWRYYLRDVKHVIGSRRNDSLIGDEDSNYMDGGAGDDIIEGNEGDDHLVPGTGNDHVDGYTGSDWVHYSFSDVGVNVNLSAGFASYGQWRDTLLYIENVEGSRHHDTLTGDDSGGVVQGGDGHDRLTATDGTTRLEGNRGHDTLKSSSNSGAVTVQVGGTGNDSLYSAFPESDAKTTFIFDDGDGDDMIWHFKVGRDTLEFASDVTYSVHENGVLATYTGGSVVIRGVSLSDISPESVPTPTPEPEAEVTPEPAPAAPKPPYKVIKGNGNNNSLTGTNGRDSINGFA